MTKPLHDEALAKLPISFEVQANVRILETAGLGVCGQLHADAIKPAIVKPRAKAPAIKSRLARSMHRLHNLEDDSAPEKKVNVDLDGDLYQMENY